MSTMLFAASCQKDAASDVQEEYVTAVFTVETNQQPESKAVISADQKTVGDGLAADNLVFAVFDSEGNELTDLRLGDWVNMIGENNAVIKFDNSEKPKATVTVTLVR